MGKVFQIESSNRDEIRHTLSGAIGKNTLSDLELDLLLILCRKKRKFGNRVDTPPLEMDSVFGIRPGGGKYVINLPNAVLLSAAVTLDILLTSGAATALISAVGKNPQAITVLNEKTGSLCHYISLEQLPKEEFPVSAKALSELTKDVECSYLEFNCDHCGGGICQVSESAVSQNIAVLDKSHVIVMTDEGAVARISR